MFESIGFAHYQINQKNLKKINKSVRCVGDFEYVAGIKDSQESIGLSYQWEFFFFIGLSLTFERYSDCTSLHFSRKVFACLKCWVNVCLEHKYAHSFVVALLGKTQKNIG